jgi:hypothetical protein
MDGEQGHYLGDTSDFDAVFSISACRGWLRESKVNKRQAHRP